MARLIPTLVLFFCFSLLLSSSHARSAVASTEDVPLSTADQQKDDSELESVILLPSEKLPESDRGSAAEIGGDGEEKRVGDEKLSVEQPEKEEEKEEEEEEREVPEKANWRPMDRDLDRMREIRSRHRGPRFGGGDQVRSGRMPFWKERDNAVDEDERFHHHHDHHHHHHHHRGPHGEIFAGRWIDGPPFPGADGEPMMKGEFKEPRFFFHRHHHRHHHHHHGDFDLYRGEERHGRGFWSAVRRFFGGN